MFIKCILESLERKFVVSNTYTWKFWCDLIICDFCA
jgi:hypothetical protein